MASFKVIPSILPLFALVLLLPALPLLLLLPPPADAAVAVTVVVAGVVVVDAAGAGVVLLFAALPPLDFLLELLLLSPLGVLGVAFVAVVDFAPPPLDLLVFFFTVPSALYSKSTSFAFTASLLLPSDAPAELGFDSFFLFEFWFLLVPSEAVVVAVVVVVVVLLLLSASSPSSASCRVTSPAAADFSAAAVDSARVMADSNRSAASLAPSHTVGDTD
mmetsp:Transcript_6987/g.11742  ORF Transcript_6987/g.11742 Transcript_6987/m.11742 type:complete len:218 (-) Transcript_6987:912-1565(-)